MGLTVHFKLTVAADLADEDARKLVVSMHRKALRFQREGRFDRVHPVSSKGTTENHRIFFNRATHWRFMREEGKPVREHQIEVWPRAAFLFPISVGQDCEPLWVGLCRYPERVWYVHFKREVRTLVGGGWRFKGFSKTQFASLHGWEHFVRCHCAIVHFLAACESPDMRVKISDEGEYWPRQSLKKLRQNLDQMNGVVAASAGALRDLYPEAKGADAVQSPVFARPQFERLEAEGAARVAPALKKLQGAVKKTSPY